MALGKKKMQMQGAAGLVPSKNFTPVTYTGDGSTQSISTLDFQPDLVWVKRRNVAIGHHVLFDSVRGAGKRIFTSLTNVEDTGGNQGVVSSFDTDGFTIDPQTAAGLNTSGTNYVAWCWKAADTTTTIGANTVGNTIASDVRANQEAGFSVISYSGNQTAATVGHGLSQAPEMIIAKSRTVAQNWAVYHKDAGSNYWLQLNGTIAKIDEPIWNDTTPTNSVFSMNGNVVINKSGSDNIAYAFHSVDGYQKVGFYNGNGGSNSITELGFTPRFVLFKCATTTGDWIMLDAVRGSSVYLTAESSAQEVSTWFNFTFNPDGWSVNTSNNNVNGSGQTYIYLAIA